jgi:hypothetical protein
MLWTFTALENFSSSAEIEPTNPVSSLYLGILGWYKTHHNTYHSRRRHCTDNLSTQKFPVMKIQA